MQKKYCSYLLAALLLCYRHTALAKERDTLVQVSVVDFAILPQKIIQQSKKKYTALFHSIEKANKKIAKRFRAYELIAFKDKNNIDSISSIISGRYQQIMQTSGRGNLNDYVPRLDSLHTGMKFLQQISTQLVGLDIKKVKQIELLEQQIGLLNEQWQVMCNIRKMVAERASVLITTLKGVTSPSVIRKLQKQAYYYQKEWNEYKNLLSDPDKIANKLLTYFRTQPAYLNFLEKNSQLASLFPATGLSSAPPILAGLQTRDGLLQNMQQSGIPNAPQSFQNQVNQASEQLNKMKNKLNQLGGQNEGALEMPDFRPNTQKTKTFWKRVEWGINVQSQKSNIQFPVSTDFALTGGYKLNDKSILGLGIVYKLGLGNSLKEIKISHQGIGFRSFMDIRFKGSIWVSGGYEWNYQQEIKQIAQLKDINAWQQSALIGLTKKYQIGKKKGNVQVLWDFLSYQQLPATKAFKFRIGYTF